MTAQTTKNLQKAFGFKQQKGFEKNASYFRKNNLCLSMSRAQGVNTTADYWMKATNHFFNRKEDFYDFHR